MLENLTASGGSHVDLRYVKPVRWIETRRRIEAIKAYLSQTERTNDAMARAGRAIGLSGEQFRRLVRAWELHQDALLIQPRGSTGPRNRPDGLSSRVKDIMDQVLRDLGTPVDLKDAAAEIRKRCAAACEECPSDQYIWKALMRARRSNRAPAEGVGNFVLIGRVWFEIPVIMMHGAPPVRPEAVIALAVPSKAIIAHRSAIELGRTPKVDDILPDILHEADVRLTPLEAGRTISPAMSGSFSFHQGAQTDVTRYLGCGIGNLPVRYRRPQTNASDLIASSFDRPLGLEDGHDALEMAFRIHADEVRAGKADLGHLS